MKRFFLLALTAGLLSPIAVESEGLYDTQKEAWEACVAWWKEAGDFYITEGEGYDMFTRKLPLSKHCGCQPRVASASRSASFYLI